MTRLSLSFRKCGEWIGEWDWTHRDMLRDYWNRLGESCFNLNLSNNKRDDNKNTNLRDIKDVKLTDLILFRQYSLGHVIEYFLSTKGTITRLSFKDIGWYEMEISPAASEALLIYSYKSRKQWEATEELLTRSGKIRLTF